MNSKFLKCAAVLIVAATVFALASCSFPGQVEETTTEAPIIALTEMPTTAEAALGYFNRLINGVKAAKPGVAMERKRDIKDISAENAGGKLSDVGALISIAKGYINELDKVKDSREYGADLTDFMPIKGTGVSSALTMDDIISAECVEPEDDDSVYVVTVVLKDVENPTPGTSIAKAFDLDINKSAILEQFRDYTDSVTVSDYKTNYTGCQITLKVDKETDNIKSVEYLKNVVVTSDVVFNGTLSSWGEANVTLTFSETTNYKDFVWEAPTEAVEE